MRVAVVPVQHGLLVFKPREDDLLAAGRPRGVHAEASRRRFQCTHEIREPAGRGPALIRRLTSGERRSEDHRRQHQHSPDFTQRFHNNLLRERYGGLAALMLPIRPTVIVDGWEAGAAGWAGWAGWAGGAEGQDGQEGAGRL